MEENSLWTGGIENLNSNIVSNEAWGATPNGSYLTLLAKNQIGIDIQPGTAAQSIPMLVAHRLLLSPMFSGSRATVDLRFNASRNRDGRILAAFTFGEAVKVMAWDYGKKKSGSEISNESVTLRLKTSIPANASALTLTITVLGETRNSEGLAMFTIESGDFARLEVK